MNARKVDVSEYQIKPSETPTSKTDFLIFLTNNRLLVGTIYIRSLIYLKAVYEQKMKEIYFSTLATKLRFWSIIVVSGVSRKRRAVSLSNDWPHHWQQSGRKAFYRERTRLGNSASQKYFFL